jgi:hypothetical protein
MSAPHVFATTDTTFAADVLRGNGVRVTYF